MALLLTACSTGGWRGSHYVKGTWGEGFFPDVDLPTTNPEHIALLVPLKGRLADSGKAIHNGFLAAYYYQKQNSSHVPKLTVIDTSQGNIHQLYQQALDKGANMVVGPLTKNNVQQLASRGQLEVPTIALNTLSYQPSEWVENLYQFGLSPKDGAIQAADRAIDARQHRALIIAPQGDWGQSIAQAFRKQYLAKSGVVVDQVNYPTQQRDITNYIKQALAVDKSESRAKKMEALLDDDISFTPQSRSDIDAIFVVALPQQGRVIRPLLEYYYAGDTPVYSVSAIYSGKNNPQQDKDLNGVYFSDMPWVLTPDMYQQPRLQAIHKHIVSVWPASYERQPKLYALGIDAYTLTERLRELISAPEYGISGATGNLYLTPQLTIFRQLDWAKFEKGLPQVIS